MRAPVDDIPTPLFPRALPWANVATLRMEQQRGRPVLVEFWDFCRVNSLRTLPYVQAWHEKYEADGLRVIGMHSPGFEPSRDEDAVRAAVERLGVEYAVGIDTGLEVWKAYENRGWPARYLWNERLRLFEYHYGEGGYVETERAIQELLGVERELVEPVRPEDDPTAMLVVPTPDVAGPFSGPYGAGEAWAVLSGTGSFEVNGESREVAWPGCHPLVVHDVHTDGVLDVRLGDGITCHATNFLPGLAP